MRVLGFSKKWSKLNYIEFTTFRRKRLDGDWHKGEIVQVYFKPRSPMREFLGQARIIEIQVKCPMLHGDSAGISDQEAIKDGFTGRDDMLLWLVKTHKGLPVFLNKLTLRWLRGETRT